MTPTYRPHHPNDHPRRGGGPGSVTTHPIAGTIRHKYTPRDPLDESDGAAHGGLRRDLADSAQATKRHLELGTWTTGRDTSG